MSATNIEWTDVAWNPVTGCDRVSPGCAHCYARTMAKRLKAMGAKGYECDGGPASGPGFAVTLHPERLSVPFHWRKPKRVFVNSMSDLFHDQVPDEFIDQVFAVMAICGVPRQMCRAGKRCTHDEEPGCWRHGDGQEMPIHTFQILTKRPQRMTAYLAVEDRAERIREAVNGPDWDIEWDDMIQEFLFDRWPLPNVWLGVSVENQRWADERIPLLLHTPAAVRFVSCEPLLGSVDIARTVREFRSTHPFATAGISWVIVGGESGPQHRPMDLAWVQAIREQCRDAGVAYFGKQLGGAKPGVPLPFELGDQEFPR